MKKNNLWNRVFHNKEINTNKEQYELYKRQIATAQEFIGAIKNVDDLTILVNIHKDAYGSGFTLNLGPCEFGICRCENIATMTPNQVYLGGTLGLNTYAIPYWEQHKDEVYGSNGFGIKEETSLYKLILDQYKYHLISNISAMYNKAIKEISRYELCGYKKN